MKSSKREDSREAGKDSIMKSRATVHDEIIRALNFLHPDGAVFELCAIGLKQTKSQCWEGYAGSKKRVVAGWFRDHATAANLAVNLDQIGAEGIFVTINPDASLNNPLQLYEV
jgi:hypothetical protein